MKKVLFSALLFGTMLLTACQKNSLKEEALKQQEETGLARNNQSEAAALARPQSWADCLLFDGVVTPAKFKPESDPFDELYMNNLGIGFKDGKALISESKPGDRDYNGGRWHLNVIKPTVDAAKYKNACSLEDIDVNDFMSTDNYFECPLLPRK
jgi:hypothetical protein